MEDKIAIISLENIPEEVKSLPDDMFAALERGEIGDEIFKTQPVGFLKDSMMRLVRKKMAMVSLGFILLVIFLAIFAPSFNEYTYVQQHVTPLDLRNMPPRIPLLENFGIFDGRRVIPNRRLTTAQDPEQFPP